MDIRRFDALSRSMATSGTRRGLLRGLSGLTAVGLAAVGFSREARFARALQNADSEEQSVLLFEELARIVDEDTGTCADQRANVATFVATNGDLLESLRAEQDAWSTEQRLQHAETYGDRRWAATTLLMANLARCAYAVSHADLPTSAPIGTPEASTPVAKRSRREPALLHAVPAAQAAGACTDVVPVVCVKVGDQTWDSDIHEIYAICPDGLSSNCQLCQDSRFCVSEYPDDCPDPSSCILAIHVSAVETCCEQNCPVSTASCIADWAAAASGDNCLGCQSSWCGSTSHCLTTCQTNECCNEPCSSYSPPPVTPPDAGP